MSEQYQSFQNQLDILSKKKSLLQKDEKQKDVLFGYNKLERFNQFGVKNPLEDDIDANSQNILNINGLAATELSSDIAKFNSLTVDGVAVTGSSSGIQIKNDGNTLNPNANIINFKGNQVSSSASSGEATITIGLPDLVVTKDGTTLNQVTGGINGTALIDHNGAGFAAGSTWGAISLLPAIGTTVHGFGVGVNAEFVFNRAVTVYMVHSTYWLGNSNLTVDTSKWWEIETSTSGNNHREHIHWHSSVSINSTYHTTKLYFRIFPAGTHMLDNSAPFYFFKPFPS
jgi:hypothetical protein